MITISILFSQTDDHALVPLGLLLEALRNGAPSYVLKDSNSNYLIQAIKAVMSEPLRLTTANLMNKRDLKTKTELVRFAIKRGLIMVD